MNKRILPELRFGTSGIRGKDEELNDIQVYIATKAFLNSMLNSGLRNTKRVALAGDFRPSTPRILKSIGFAIIETGLFIDYLGKIPTPTLAYYGFSNKILSIMVTGSHNPYGENGVKFNKQEDELLKEDEKRILEELNNIRLIEQSKTLNESLFDEKGYFKPYESLNEDNKNKMDFVSIALSNSNKIAQQIFIERYKRAFENKLSGIKLVFYQHTAVGRDLIPKIFESLGAEVIVVEKNDEKNNFVALDTEDLDDKIIIKMKDHAIKNDCEIAITTDGDSDRPAMVVVDKKTGKYEFIRGDKLNVLGLLNLKPDFVSCPISANKKVIEVLRKKGIEVKHTKIGSPYVIKAMKDKLEGDKEIEAYGFEVNGGGLLGNTKRYELDPLPTRDAILPIILVLINSIENNMKVSETLKNIFKGEHKSHSHAGVIENLNIHKFTRGCERYTSKIGKKMVNRLMLNEKVLEIDYSQEGIKIIDLDQNRMFGGEIIDKAIEIKRTLLTYIQRIEGLEKKDIKKVNSLDGIRIILENDEVIHLRPSGNSNQFRIYSEAETKERAEKIIKESIKSEEGIIIGMINDLIDGKI